MQVREGEGAGHGARGARPLQAEAASSLGLDSCQRQQGLRLHQKIVLHFSEHLTALLSSTEERADSFAGGKESSVKVI